MKRTFINWLKLNEEIKVKSEDKNDDKLTIKKKLFETFVIYLYFKLDNKKDNDLGFLKTQQLLFLSLCAYFKKNRSFEMHLIFDDMVHQVYTPSERDIYNIFKNRSFDFLDLSTKNINIKNNINILYSPIIESAVDILLEYNPEILKYKSSELKDIIDDYPGVKHMYKTGSYTNFPKYENSFFEQNYYNFYFKKNNYRLF